MTHLIHITHSWEPLIILCPRPTLKAATPNQKAKKCSRKIRRSEGELIYDLCSCRYTLAWEMKQQQYSTRK